MQSNDIMIIQDLLDNKKDCFWEKDEIVDIINNKIERLTGCILYNKENVIKKIDTLNANLIPIIDFNDFRNKFNLNLIFYKDQPQIVYNNTMITKSNIKDIMKNIVETKREHIPVIPNLFLENMENIINKFINKDLSVKYNCSNMTTIYLPWWKLFEMKCYKQNKHANQVLEKYKYMDDIISGKNFAEEDKENDPELAQILKEIKEFEESKEDISDDKQMDDQYRMEVMTYLDDNEMGQFLEDIEKIDNYNKESNIQKDIVEFIKFMLDIVSINHNKIYKVYFVNVLFKYIISKNNFLKNHYNFQKVVKSKINELEGDIVELMQSSGLKLANEIFNTLAAANKMIKHLESDSDDDSISEDDGIPETNVDSPMYDSDDMKN